MSEARSDSADLHIDDFCKDAARTLLHLYGVFPRPLILHVEDISGPDEPDEYGLHSPRHLACLAAILWLAEEGLVRYTDVIRQEAVDQAVLTGRAFRALTLPAGPSGGASALASSNINRLRRVIADGTSDQAREVVLDILGVARRV